LTVAYLRRGEKMGKRQPVIIGATEFLSKKEASAYCTKLLASYNNGQTVNEQDAEFLSGLLKRHPEAGQKIGAGVKRFFKDSGPEPNYGTDCFWVEQIDGTKVDFSFKTCVAGR
jgi:Protein of unknown function (DUF3223)